MEDIRANPNYSHLEFFNGSDNKFTSMRELVGSQFLKSEAVVLDLLGNQIQGVYEFSDQTSNLVF